MNKHTPADIAENLKKIVTRSLEVPEESLNANNFLIIYDLLTPLSKTLFQGYAEVLPKAKMVEYYSHTTEQVIEAVNQCQKGDLVILIESGSFRMSNFRWRLELFNRGLKVIEHAHLKNNLESEHDNYLDSLDYQEDYLRTTAEFLCTKINQAKQIKIVSTEGNTLIYNGPFEDAKKNIGDFRQMRNKGCGFPIGEVFTESLKLTDVNGFVEIYGFADIEHKMVFVEKAFLIEIKNAQLQLDTKKFAELDATVEGRKFLELFSLLKTENSDGLVWTRELGLGLNKGINRKKRLTDVSAYERVCGVHMSLGLKHDIYRGKSGEIAPGIARSERYHVDIFPEVKEVWIDSLKVFESGEYLVPESA